MAFESIHIFKNDRNTLCFWQSISFSSYFPKPFPCSSSQLPHLGALSLPTLTRVPKNREFHCSVCELCCVSSPLTTQLSVAPLQGYVLSLGGANPKVGDLRGERPSSPRITIFLCWSIFFFYLYLFSCTLFLIFCFKPDHGFVVLLNCNWRVLFSEKEKQNRTKQWELLSYKLHTHNLSNLHLEIPTLSKNTARSSVKELIFKRTLAYSGWEHNQPA